MNCTPAASRSSRSRSTPIPSPRPYIEAANVDFPVLIDRAHVLGELLGIVNVPSSVWIDEQGMLVRPVDTSIVGRRRTTFTDPRTQAVPAEMAALAREFTRTPERYVEALHDWVDHGAGSEWALSPDEVIARSAPRSQDAARAAAHFELGEYLRESGDVVAAQAHWREAHRLAPDNWTYRRQAWDLVDPTVQGPTEIYESSWVQDVLKSGPENYYPPMTR